MVSRPLNVNTEVSFYHVLFVCINTFLMRTINMHTRIHSAVGTGDLRIMNYGLLKVTSSLIAIALVLTCVTTYRFYSYFFYHVIL